MNIFAVDEDPILCAKYMHDRHVVKMILESAQMLCTIRLGKGITDPKVLKPTHHKHPSTLWAGSSLQNYQWLVRHFKALCEEYTYRYYKVHKLHDMLPMFSERLEPIPSLGLTPFAMAMPPEYKGDDPITAYQRYYIGRKIKKNYWTNRTRSELPDWLTQHLNAFKFKLNREETIRCKLIAA